MHMHADIFLMYFLNLFFFHLTNKQTNKENEKKNFIKIFLKKRSTGKRVKTCKHSKSKLKKKIEEFLNDQFQEKLKFVCLFLSFFLPLLIQWCTYTHLPVVQFISTLVFIFSVYILYIIFINYLFYCSFFFIHFMSFIFL